MSTDTLLLCLTDFLPLFFSFFSKQHTTFGFLNNLPLPEKAGGSFWTGNMLLLPEQISGLVRVNVMDDTTHLGFWKTWDFTAHINVKINVKCKVKRAHTQWIKYCLQMRICHLGVCSLQGPMSFLSGPGGKSGGNKILMKKH